MKKAIAVILGLGLAGGATHALAGSKSTLNVTVTSTFFSGTIGDARASSDNQQLIYCGLFGQSGNNLMGSCGARNASGTQAVCNVDATTNPALGYVLATITPMSSINVQYASNGMCTQINVHNGSQNRPPTP